MGMDKDIEERLKDKPVSNIFRLPDHQNTTKLQKELCKIAFGVPGGVRARGLEAACE